MRLPIAKLALTLCGLSVCATPLALAQQRPDPANIIARFDTDGDGSVSQAELDASRTVLFQSGDLDGDGFLASDDERAAFLAAVEANRPSGGRGRGGPGGGGQRGGPRGNQGGDPLSLADSDGDGQVSLDEFLALPHPLTRMDADGDGVITATDIETSMANMRGRMGGGGRGRN